MMPAMVAPPGRRNRSSTRACFECARFGCRPAILLLAPFRTLEIERDFVVRDRLLLDIVTLLSCCRRNIAPPPPKPRGGPTALAGQRSEPVRPGVRGHHACSVQDRSRVQSDRDCQ